MELHLRRRNPTATELVLDTRDLAIEKAETAAGTNAWVKTTFNLDRPTPIFGSALRIVMPPDTDRVRVTYATSPNARALQWLARTQTAGKRHPFLFTQAWAIQARSFIPLQDLPSVRMTYDATNRNLGTGGGYGRRDAPERRRQWRLQVPCRKRSCRIDRARHRRSAFKSSARALAPSLRCSKRPRASSPILNR